MSSNAANVKSTMPRVTGAVRNAPKGTAGPTDASVALPAEWVDLGYVGEDGVTETIGRDTDKKKSYGGATVRILQTDFSNTFKFVLMESGNADVLKRVFGEDNVIIDGKNITIRKNKATLPTEAWVFDHADGKDLIRQWIPEGQVSEIGDITFVHSDTIVYELTLESFESEQIDGDNSREFRYVDALAGGGDGGGSEPENP